MTTTTVQLVRGDLFTLVVRLDLADFDWSGTVARCHVRTSDDRLVWNFSAEGGIATEVDADGKFAITLSATGLATKRWPIGRLEGDVEVEKSSAAWGPYTAAAFRIDLTKDRTR